MVNPAHDQTSKACEGLCKKRLLGRVKLLRIIATRKQMPIAVNH
jgi:hypothetical protein